MLSPLRVFLSCALVSLGLPTAAAAKTAVVPPFVGKSGVDSLQVLNITSLVSSEVDFTMVYDNVKQLETMPAGMNVSCLSSTKCLYGIAKANEAEVLIGGSVSKAGDQFDIFMVHYDRTRGAIVRKNSWKISSDPASMADRMGGLVAEIVTGKSQKQAQAENSVAGLADDFLDDGDDFSFDEEEELEVGRRIATPAMSEHDLDDFELLDAEESGNEAELMAKRQAEQEAARMAAEDAARKKAAEAARRKAEAEARRRAEEEARRRAEEEARLAKEAARRRAAEEAERNAREEARRRAKEEARRLADERRRDAERRRQEEEAAALAAQEDEEEEDDFDLVFAPVGGDEMEIELAPAADLIAVEPLEDDLEEFGPASEVGDALPGRFDYGEEEDSLADAYEDLDSAPRRSSSFDLDDFDLDDDEEDEARDRERTSREKTSRVKESKSRYEELDEDRRSSSSRSMKGTQVDSEIRGAYSERRYVSLAARLGTSGFQTLRPFVTYGAELAFPVGDLVRIQAGLEAFSVKRTFPGGLCDDEGTEGDIVQCTRWNTILPMHVGARYQRSESAVRPYFGADFTFTAYTENFDFAPGLRGRGGVDFMPSDRVGLNLNAGIGLMHGSKFTEVDKTLSPTGFVWQLSAGTVFML